MASGKNTRKNDTGSWILIAVLFVVGLWPIALIVLFVKLFGADEKKRRVPPPLEQQEMEMPQMPVSWVVSMSSEVRNMAGNAVANFQRKTRFMK